MNNQNKPKLMMNNFKRKTTYFAPTLSLFLCFGVSHLYAQKFYVGNNGIEKVRETYQIAMAGKSKGFNDPNLVSSDATSIDIAKGHVAEKAIIKNKIILDALTHFSNISAGEVSYYKDAKNNALAINAGNVANRGKFATATTIFNGTSGIYDVTLTTLAEFDGECTYRFW